MVGFAKSIGRILSNRGLAELLKIGYRKVRSQALLPFEPIHDILTPRETTITVGQTSARFDMGAASLASYDFRDDIRSESQVLNRFLSDLSSNDHVWDIGANVGVYTCFAGCHTNCTISAFEPDPIAISRLHTNIRLNNTPASVYEVGLWDKSGTGQLPISQRASNQISPTKNGCGRNIDLCEGERFIRRHDIPIADVIKIDVEGGEGPVLRGLGDLISDARVIYVEVHPTRMEEFGDQPENIRNLLTDHFSLQQIIERRGQRIIRGEHR